MNDRPNYFLFSMVILLLIIVLVLLVYSIRFQTSISPKANFIDTTRIVSIDNSYVFASPVRAKAGGDLIRITVFILDDYGNGVFDKKVNILSDNPELTVNEIQSLTDETGKAFFDVKSDIVGIYNLSVFSDETEINQKIKVVFD